MFGCLLNISFVLKLLQRFTEIHRYVSHRGRKDSQVNHLNAMKEVCRIDLQRYMRGHCCQCGKSYKVQLKLLWRKGMLWKIISTLSACISVRMVSPWYTFLLILPFWDFRIYQQQFLHIEICLPSPVSENWNVPCVFLLGFQTKSNF